MTVLPGSGAGSDAMLEEYLGRCRSVSLTARLAIALLVFERHCRSRGLAHPHLSGLSDYLWEWPRVFAENRFAAWLDARPELVNSGLGDPLPPGLVAPLHGSGIDPDDFHRLLSHLLEILWRNFWGAADDQAALDDLRAVIRLCRAERLPPLEPFGLSLFKDHDGWGKPVRRQDRDAWRALGGMDGSGWLPVAPPHRSP